MIKGARRGATRWGRWVATLVCLLSAGPLLAEEIKGTVDRVIDGDTIVLRLAKGEGGRGETALDKLASVRLLGIDCPEKGQGYWIAARDLVLDLVRQHVVVVDLQKKKTYGRGVGTVKLPDGRVVNEELLRAGLCWWDHTYSKDTNWGRLEVDARAAGKGLWADRAQVPPWAFRKGEKRLQNSGSSQQE